MAWIASSVVAATARALAAALATCLLLAPAARRARCLPARPRARGRAASSPDTRPIPACSPADLPAPVPRDGALPGAPDIALRGGRLCVEGSPPPIWRGGSARRSTSTRSAAMARALARYQARSGRPRSPALLRGEGQLDARRAANASRARGCGFDIVSGGELERVLAAGGDPARVVFSGVGKTRRRDEARARRRRAVLQRRERRRARAARRASRSASGQRARVSLRVNPDVDAEDPSLHLDRPARQQVRHRPRPGTRRRFARAARLPGLEVIGIDCHIGSQIVDAGPVRRRARSPARPGRAGRGRRRRARAHRRRRRPRHHLRDETPPDAGVLVGRLLERIDARGHGQRRIVLEPGRSLVGNAGVLVSEVLYLKPGDEKNFCIVDAAMNDLMRPAMYERMDADRRVRAARRGRASPATSSARSANPATGSAATARSRSRRATSSPCCRPAPTP